MATARVNYSANSFWAGWLQLPIGETKKVRDELMDGLGIASWEGFRKRRAGMVDHSPSEARFIESVFAQYGITEVWGDRK